MKNLIREPLLHFLVIGASLFLVYSLANDQQNKNEIIIDQYIINDLSAKWKLQWKRAPTLGELKRLVKLYIDQEALYREALAMNLDHNDEIIKRRLAKKMEFITDDLAASLHPSVDMLKAYYFQNIKNYAKPPKYTFSQVYFASKNENKLRQALANENPENFGDQLSLPTHYTAVDGLKVSIDFGQAFSQALDTLALHKWLGPVRSGYGNHLVYIEEKESSGEFTFAEVADKVLIDYNYHASNDFRKELINTMLKRYEIRIEVSDKDLKKELIESL